MLDDVRFPRFPRRFPCVALVPLCLCAVLSTEGCHRAAPAAEAGAQSSPEQQRAMNEAIRQELDAIPPPVKSKFVGVHDLREWRNPFVTVQDNMLVLHVTLADANTSDLGEGGMLRPTGARRQDLSIRVTELPAALNAIPQTAWPYGRVLAVEEAHGTPQSVEPAVRRTMERVMRTLNDLGVVVYEWGDGGPELR